MTRRWWRGGNHRDPLGGAQLAMTLQNILLRDWDLDQVVEAVAELVEGHRLAMTMEQELRRDHPQAFEGGDGSACEQLLVNVVLGRTARCRGCGYHLVKRREVDFPRCESSGRAAETGHCSRTGKAW